MIKEATESFSEIKPRIYDNFFFLEGGGTMRRR
jgi:hypothetical protein